MRAATIPILLITFFLFTGATYRPTADCRIIINDMLDSIRNIRSQTFSVKSTERVNGRLLFAESEVKLQFSPRKIYFHNPEKGVEVLWTAGSNKGNASVHSRSIPLMNFDLDPYGSIMRKDQHHTIFELGTPYIGSIIANTILKAPREFDKHFAYAGVIAWNGLDCHQILISYPEYKYVEYVTKKNETVSSIAKALNTSDFKIRYKNGLSSYFGDIKEGKKLLIPVPYSNRAIIYIDKKTALPVNVKIFDEEGLFESYEFYKLKVNPSFADDEFSTEFKGYGF